MRRGKLKKLLRYLGIALLLIVVVSGCSSDSSHKESSDDQSHSSQKMKMHHGSNSQKDSSLKKAKDPKYKAGSKVKLSADHMKGMKNANATIVNAYDSKLYAVDYKPSSDKKVVKDHKWVTNDEIEGNRREYGKGDKVTLTADHMPGIKNSSATIVEIKDGPAYMVNYQPTNGDKQVKNHKWVAEDELKAR
ncbi:hypothetical protein FD11_GL000432 [Ligilactobacillus pobuzihii E100301 = KCTC 13174]|uniref:DUF1541 domain-containing protein n=1 Tax=Ligilactobacillus pobuzihii TaxID=449659 RepID=A0A0R2LFN5_9LACO|nr:hypothetical protein FD11_GL000432 [Ligilactobacillus pobuzihii E100301 = KCTC 13174]KRO00654.1 hypothetical protein IV66_GL001328 [Ligilactobacillus pobuzihii]